MIVPGAVASLPKALSSYAPDGAWGEGPGYWNYATRYTVYWLTAMQTALGTDFGLLNLDGLNQAGRFLVRIAMSPCEVVESRTFQSISIAEELLIFVRKRHTTS